MRSRLSTARFAALEAIFMAVVIVAGLLVVPPAPAAADDFTDPSFTTETVATFSPFSLVGLAFAPDGRMFVWQKNGVIRIVKNGAVLPTPFLDISAKVNTYDDRGMWGLAFDPNFSANGHIYLTYVFENTGNTNSTGAKTARLTRVTASPTNPDVAQTGSEIVILGSVGTPPCSAHPAGTDCIPADGGTHTLGSIVFAPDGTMFLGNGDGSGGGTNDVLALRAQDLNSYNGKILRINKDGTAVPGNPFYDGTNSVKSKVWLYGVRNPFRFSIQPNTGHVWFGDVGWNTWEEINRGVPGANYGWPCYEGASVQPAYADEPPCLALPASEVTQPFHTYNHSVGSTAIGGPIYTGNAYPEEYRNNFFFADYAGRFIKRVVFDGNNNPVSVQPFATQVDTPVGLVQGPDGLIYYLSFNSGQIRRIRSNGPSAKAAATPGYGYSPLQVNFSSAGSENPGGGSLSYLWDFGDGTTSTAANPSHTYTSATVRTFTAMLTVTNSSNRSSSDTVSVTVGSVPPVPTITSPASGFSVQAGQTVNFAGLATDAEDGAIPPANLTWTVLLHHNTHVHTFVGGTGASGNFVVEDHGPIGTFSYEIILTATDSSGLQASTSVVLPVGSDITPPTAPTNLTASASGSSVALGWGAATDDVALAGYRVERCQGSACSTFAQVATPTTTTYVDTGLLPSTSYSYRVVAVDASGNVSGYSNIASVTTPTAPPLPSGLIAGYTFDAGSGTTVTDISGNGNTGTITGATWTAGRYGGGLSFDGAGAVVRIPSAPSLNPGAAMTLAAWIQPAALQSGWRTIMQRETDAYFLNASNNGGNNFPSGGATTGTATKVVRAAAAAPVAAWTHVALTFDGAALRLYVNGVQVATSSAGGTVQSSSSPLWIGGNSPYGEYFRGVIDEAQVYNRALSATEVQNVMTHPLVPPMPDTTPPTAPTALIASPVGANQINLSWSASTDNVAVTGYTVESCQGTGCSEFTQVGTATGATFSSTDLAASTTYSFRVRATDAAGNVSDFSAVASASTTAVPDTTAPSPPSDLTAIDISTTSVDLEWTASTDNVGVTSYGVERCQGSGCTNFVQIAAPTGTSHGDTGLVPATLYRYRVRAADAADNLSGYSSIVNATTAAPPDTTAPTVPTGVTATASGLSITVAWTASTDNVGVSGYRVQRCQDAGCSTFTLIASPAAPGYSDTDLAPNTSYSYRVAAVDAAGNTSDFTDVVSTTTGSAPVLPAGLVAGYSFETGAGTTVADLSGNGNSGTITGATWAAGRHGGGLMFDGVNDLVTVASAPSLNVGSAITLAAWIKPTAAQTGWRTIIQRQVDNYFLNASNGNGALVPAGGARVGSGLPVVTGTSSCSVGSWTHVAMTFDGTTMRLYVNGVQVASRASSGLIPSSSSPMYLGGNVPYGEFFRGVIDDAQVYNRALNPAEIQTVMGTPLG
jgi:glucose/arabinose dehydrogenase/fibronectin type 3 domain-containing protein